MSVLPTIALSLLCFFPFYNQGIPLGNFWCPTDKTLPDDAFWGDAETGNFFNIFLPTISLLTKTSSGNLWPPEWEVISCVNLLRNTWCGGLPNCRCSVGILVVKPDSRPFKPKHVVCIKNTSRCGAWYVLTWEWKRLVKSQIWAEAWAECFTEHVHTNGWAAWK